jgi:Arc/MetJ family transcription regulator
MELAPLSAVEFRPWLSGAIPLASRLQRLIGIRITCQMLRGGLHMATNLSIDPDLIDRALEVSGERTKKAAVTKALQEFIARRRQKQLRDLMGKLEWDTAYDYKTERGRD